MDNCITITPGILLSNYINSEHIYTYMDLCIRDYAVCLYCTGYTVLYWCKFSSTGVLNLMYLWNLLFAHSNIFKDPSAIILDPGYTILAKSEIVLYVSIGLNNIPIELVGNADRRRTVHRSSPRWTADVRRQATRSPTAANHRSPPSYDWDSY